MNAMVQFFVFIPFNLKVALALMDLYLSTSGPIWLNNTNWMSGDPCRERWSGVKCSFIGDVVLDLYVFYSLQTHIRECRSPYFVNFKFLETFTPDLLV